MLKERGFVFIRAALVIGSRARSDHPTDDWSDLDIAVVTIDPRRFLDTGDWIQQFGHPWLTFVEPSADGRGMETRANRGQHHQYLDQLRDDGAARLFALRALQSRA